MRVSSPQGRLPARSTALVVPAGASNISTTGRVMGSFALPVAAEWGHQILPPGIYTFVVPSAAFPAWVYVRGGGDSAVFFTASVRRTSGGPMSSLVLLHDRNGYHVRSLKLRNAGKVLHFGDSAPEGVPRPVPRRFATFSVRLRPSGDGPGGLVLALLG